MGIFDIFKKPKALATHREEAYTEVGGYRAQFSAFGSNAFDSDIVRSCVRALANHSSKANANSSDKNLMKILNGRPNLYQTGPAFLQKVRTLLEVYNNVFVMIMRDDKGHASGFYPIPYRRLTAIDLDGELYIKFEFANPSKQLFVAWADLLALRYDYGIESDIVGSDNRSILPGLELVNTTNQGIANAVKSTANLRGILKATKGMLAPEAIKRMKDDFVRDYMNLENEGGIASLDASQEFTPITMSPVVTSFAQMKEFRENIQRHFGVSDAIILSDFTEGQMEAFYQSKIEPFLVALSKEIEDRCFTEREKSFGAYFVYEANHLQFASTATKLGLVAMVDRASLTPNEWRHTMNLAPLPGGDEPILRLDTGKVNEPKEGESEND